MFQWERRGLEEEPLLTFERTDKKLVLLCSHVMYIELCMTLEPDLD